MLSMKHNRKVVGMELEFKASLATALVVGGSGTFLAQV